ncbi:uncharacterized protein CCR75_005627 [Bremia lactucae]|uniref:ORC6 second cyclin-like domain-containing protein n=1 Tax=Bremia lactucae TaxID=4779 RepID=A0A976FH25_BRELC|nr:hypothetical protein CCR75_005627 [Bremia lactucae]
MDIKTIAAKYGGLPARVVTRAEENWRITTAKNSAVLDFFAGPVACIIVAARALDEPVDKKRLAKCAGANIKLVEPIVRKVLNAVDIRTVIKTSPSALCIKFGCEALTEIVRHVLEEYRVYVKQLATANQRKRSRHSLGPVAGIIDDKDPVFAAACLFAVSKKAKINVNQDKLLDAVCGNAKAFNAIVSSIEVPTDVCLVYFHAIYDKTQCQISLNGALIDRKKQRSLGKERATIRLVEQYKLDQIEAEERTKRQNLSLNSEMTSPPKTAAQKRLLQRLQITRDNVAFADNSKSFLEDTTVATLEEYAEWRAKALNFMRSKAEKDRKTENVDTY